MRMLCADVGRGEIKCFIGARLVGIIHKVNNKYVPEVILKPGHVRFCRWMSSPASAKAAIAMALRGSL